MTNNIIYIHSYTASKCEWLVLNAKWAIFQTYHCENKLHFNEMMMLFSLY